MKNRYGQVAARSSSVTDNTMPSPHGSSALPASGTYPSYSVNASESRRSSAILPCASAGNALSTSFAPAAPEPTMERSHQEPLDVAAPRSAGRMDVGSPSAFFMSGYDSVESPC